MRPGRSERRHHRWRMVRKAWRLFRMWDATKNTALDERELSVRRRAHDPERLADNLAACSYLSCQNPKTNDWYRRRERHADDDLQADS
jgi:hypothetical protein